MYDDLFRKMLADKPVGTGYLDLDGVKVTFSKFADGKALLLRVEYSADWVKQLLQRHAADILGIERPESIMVSPQIASYEDAELTSYTCTPSDRCTKV